MRREVKLVADAHGHVNAIHMDGTRVSNGLQSIEITVDVNRFMVDDGSPDVCVWRWDSLHGKWDTACGTGFFIEDDVPPANGGYKFCPACGLAIEVRHA